MRAVERLVAWIGPVHDVSDLAAACDRYLEAVEGGRVPDSGADRTYGRRAFERLVALARA